MNKQIYILAAAAWAAGAVAPAATLSDRVDDQVARAKKALVLYEKPEVFAEVAATAQH